MMSIKNKILKEELILIKNLEQSSRYIDSAIFSISRILENEEREPDMEWDFSDVKKNIDKSTLWVKTKEQAKEYLELLKNKVQNLDHNVRKKIVKYAIFSLIGILGYNQIKDISQDSEKIEPKIEKSITTGSGDKNVDTLEKQQRIRDYSEDLVKHLKYEEGSISDKGEPILFAYDIGDGAKTIGYGHAVFSNPRRGNTGGNYDFLPKYHKIIPNKTKITKKQAEILLRDDLEKSKEELNNTLNKWEKDGIKVNITQSMYDAMLSMIYNMGPSNFKKTKFIELVRQGKFLEAKEQIKNESSKMFRRFPGLKVRRENESNLFGKDINQLNESIIIETKYNKKDAANFLFRRVEKEELDDEFKDTYEYFSDNWNKRHKHRFENFDLFKKVFTTTIMDGIHGRLLDGFLETNDEIGELYDNVLEIINEIYGNRIARLWTQKTGQRV
jgi:GH24 family phage-related lysozyme (muramidase)